MSEGSEVILFDEERVVQADAVVVSATSHHGGLGEQAKSREGLSGVENFGASVGDRFHVMGCEGGDAAQVLDEVQVGSFGLEQYGL